MGPQLRCQEAWVISSDSRLAGHESCSLLRARPHFPCLPYKMGVFIIPTTQEGQEALRVLDNYTKILLKQK